VFGWAFVLCVTLPARATAANWPAVWAGLDVMEACGFAATGVLMLRHRRHRCLAAATTATLLVVDAWFDTMTAASGAELALALAMAGGLELPLAGVCAAIAWRTAGGPVPITVPITAPASAPAFMPAPMPVPVSAVSAAGPDAAPSGSDPAARLDYSRP
jgi:hypothetical protein